LTFWLEVNRTDHNCALSPGFGHLAFNLDFVPPRHYSRFMFSKPDQHYMRMAWIIICGCSLLRILYSGAFLLVPDEAYYWQWSRYLSLGYHDHPPMIAWTIKIASLFLGQTETAVRFPTILALATTSGYLTLTAKRWFGAKAAFYTALMSQSILGLNAAAMLATPDGLQLAGWAGACYHVAAAYETDRPVEWLAAGIWFGFGMLSKYTMAMFPPLAFLFGMLHPQYRRRLAGIWPYAGIGLGLLIFMPVILWNIDNGWNTFRHVAHKGGVDRQVLFQLRYIGDYIGSQIGLLSPLGFVLLILTWFLPIKKAYAGRHWVLTYLFYTSFPVVAGFAVLSLHTRVEGNWAASGYLGAAVITAAVVSRPSTKRQFIKKLWPWAIVTSYLLTVLVLLHLAWPLLPIPVRLDRLAQETTGWDVLGDKVHTLRQTMPDPENTFIFGLKYQDASTLAFYTPGQPRTVSINRWKRPNAYDYWWSDAELMGKDAVGISGNSPEHLKRLRQVFAFVPPPQKIAIHRHSIPLWSREGEPPLDTYLIYRAYGFKGGQRWTATNPDDVRTGKTP
jgi:hypothetical protein